MISFFNSKPPSLKKTVSATPGFSLIEVLVSLSIFTIVVTISVGSLMTLVEVNARTRSIHAAMTNLSFTLDSMTREIRTGTDYFCSSGSVPATGVTTSDCGNNDSVFGTALSINEGGQSLTAGKGSSRIGYRFNADAGAIERRLGDPNDPITPGDPWVAVTDPNITISSLNFYVWGSDPLSDRNNLDAPIVSIYISGYVTSRGASEEFNIQTSVTQLLLDI